MLAFNVIEGEFWRKNKLSVGQVKQNSNKSMKVHRKKKFYTFYPWYFIGKRLLLNFYNVKIAKLYYFIRSLQFLL